MCNCCVLKFQVRLTKDKETKENKGFAFVTSTDKDSTQRAVEDVKDKDYKVVWILKLSAYHGRDISCYDLLSCLHFGAGEDFAVLVVTAKAQTFCWECA
jgi:hypothetical protein